ncbi:glycosyltransferase family 8 protein [Helicobacter pylori]|uniref:glycosyltransferase family 8 protein n=1 Tax=Helicobacter pylori TaxID=210 RepID=UPI001E391130|nr:glycosyltransferase family 8 protein [Helicobacter pylori]
MLCVLYAVEWHEALIQTPFKDAYFNAPFLDHLFESFQNRDKEIHALNKILSFSDKRHSFETLLPRLSSKLLIEFLLFKAKQKVKRLIKRV